jgi:plasmid stability protein
VEFYDAGGRPNPYLDPEMRRVSLAAQQKRDLVAFLPPLTGTSPPHSRILTVLPVNRPTRGSRPGDIIASMSQLIVRKLSSRLVRRLKARAAAHGRSAEAEHRAILEAALGGNGTDFKAFLTSPPDAPDLRLRRSRDRGRSVRL